ncbi:MAG: mechanosensitive ion channel family protein [Holophagales bacterium]|nr:mechanosensitive ion channel family protein [Holophagales bacterium]
MHLHSVRTSRTHRPLLAGFLALCLFLPAGASRAEEAPAASPDSTPPQASAETVKPPVRIPPADVMVGNRKIATLRGPLFQNPPEERARVSNDRIEAAIASGRDLAVTVKAEGENRLFMIGGRGMFGLMPADLDEGAGETMDRAVLVTTARLEQAVREARERRSIPDLLKALALSVAATLVVSLLLFVLERLRRWGATKAAEKAHERLGTMRIPGKGLLEKDRLYWVTTRVLLLLTRIVDLILLYVWVTFVLKRFAWSRPWGEQLGAWFLETAGMLGMAAVKALPDLAVVGLIYLATRWLLRFVGMFFTAIEEGRIEVAETLKETTQPTRRIVTVVFWIFALIMAYPYLPGSGSEAFKGVGVMVGLMVSIGSSAVIGQLASGYMIMYSRTLKVGDYVKAGEIEGTVWQLGLFATRIRTLKKETVTIPNAVLAGQITKNYSQATDPNGIVLGTSITIGYDTPWRQVEGLLLLAAERTPGLKKEPAPWVLQRSLTDYYVDYEVCAYLEDALARVPALTALHSHILDTFNEYGVQITSPNYEADPEAPKVVPREQWFAAPARRRPEGNDRS